MVIVELEVLLNKGKKNMKILRLKNKKILEESKVKVEAMEQKFAKEAPSAVDEHLSQSTIGLVSFHEFKQKKQFLRYGDDAVSILKERKHDELRKKKATQQTKRPVNKLSFDIEEEHDKDSVEEAPNKKKKIGKDPTANTSFLPDRERIEKQIQELECKRKEKEDLEEKKKK